MQDCERPGHEFMGSNLVISGGTSLLEWHLHFYFSLLCVKKFGSTMIPAIVCVIGRLQSL